MKKMIALLLALVLVLSMAACGKEEKETAAQDNKDLYAAHLQEDGQIEMGLEGVEVEVNVSDVHMTLPKLLLPATGKLCSPLLKLRAVPST